MKIRRIFWNDGEYKTFYQEALRIRISSPELNGQQACQQAMLIMPEARRRNVNSAMVAEFNKWRAEGGKASKPPEAAPPPAAQAPTPAATEMAPTPTVLAGAIEPPLTMLPPITLDTAEDAIIDFFVDIIEGVLTHPAVVNAARQLVQSTFQRETSEAVLSTSRWPESLALARNMKVLVLGPRDREFVDIERNFGQKLALRFWNIDKSNHHLKTMASGADAIVALIPRVPHRAVNSMRSSNAQYFPVHGFDDLRRKLTELSNGRAA